METINGFVGHKLACEQGDGQERGIGETGDCKNDQEFLFINVVIYVRFKSTILVASTTTTANFA